MFAMSFFSAIARMSTMEEVEVVGDTIFEVFADVDSDILEMLEVLVRFGLVVVVDALDLAEKIRKVREWKG